MKKINAVILKDIFPILRERKELFNEIIKKHSLLKLKGFLFEVFLVSGKKDKIKLLFKNDSFYLEEFGFFTFAIEIKNNRIYYRAFASVFEKNQKIKEEPTKEECNQIFNDFFFFCLQLNKEKNIEKDLKI